MATNEMNETNQIINRHMARLLCELEDAECPVLYRMAVKAAFQWLRSDLVDKEGARDERCNGECVG